MSKGIRKVRTATVAPDETKAEKFKRLASNRTSDALASIKSISNLSNTANYEYTDDQIERILGVLRIELEYLENAFKVTGTKKKNGFSL